jgi:hypothetical protein
MIEHWFKLSAVLRTAVYFYIGLLSAFLTILYYRAYWKFKTTPIIKSLQVFLMGMAFMFCFLTIVSLSYVLGEFDKYKLVVSFIVFPAIFLAIGLTLFYYFSTNEYDGGNKK